MHGRHLCSVYAVIMAFQLIIYHDELPRIRILTDSHNHGNLMV